MSVEPHKTNIVYEFAANLCISFVDFAHFRAMMINTAEKNVSRIS